MTKDALTFYVLTSIAENAVAFRDVTGRTAIIQTNEPVYGNGQLPDGTPCTTVIVSTSNGTVILNAATVVIDRVTMDVPRNTHKTAAHQTRGVATKTDGGRRVRECLYCGKALPPDATKRRRFCDTVCRVAYHRGSIPVESVTP